MYLAARYGDLDETWAEQLLDQGHLDPQLRLGDMVTPYESTASLDLIGLLSEEVTASRATAGSFLSLVNLTMAGLSAQSSAVPLEGGWGALKIEPNLLVVSGGDPVEDCCWFWALRAQRYSPYSSVLPMWLPLTLAISHTNLIRGALQPNRPTYLLSKSAPRAELESLSIALGGDIRIVGEGFDAFFDPAFFVGIRSEEEVHFRAGVARVRRPSDDAVQFARYPSQYLIDVQVPGVKLPRVQISSWGTSSFGPTASYRILRNGGLSFMNSHRNDEFIDVAVPSPWQVFETLSDLAGYRAQLSDKGKLAGRIASLLGGYENVWPLSGTKIHRLLDQMAEASQSKEFRNRLKGLMASSPIPAAQSGDDFAREVLRLITTDDHERVTKTFGDIRHVLQPIAQGTIAGLVNWLLRSRVIFRGIHLTCPNCATKQWRTVDQLSDTLHCSGCQGSYDAPLPVDSTQWAYRMNALCARAYELGVIPHLLTASYALSAATSPTRRGQITAIFPGVILVRKADPTDVHEIDLAWLDDGLLVIGECKTTLAELTVNDVDVYDRLHRELGASRIIFGTLSSISPAKEGVMEQIRACTDDVEVIAGDRLYDHYPLRDLLEGQMSGDGARHVQFEAYLDHFVKWSGEHAYPHAK